MSQVVLITGCSTGIGRDLARRLTQAQYTVVATARCVEDLNDLTAALILPLDVVQPHSIDEAVARTLQHYGRIDVLVNNAGYALRGALEEVTDEQVQQRFAVNVFGALRMMQAVVPQMRRQGAGRIINLSSIAGRLSTPVNGTYSASKFALEALSDALRVELRPFGIQVVVVEPGAIKTHFDETALAHTQDILTNSASPYRRLYQKSDEFAGSMRRQQVGPEVVSRVIQQAIEAPRPKARYLAGVTFSGQLMLVLRDFVWGAALQRMFKFEPADIEQSQQN